MENWRPRSGFRKGLLFSRAAKLYQDFVGKQRLNEKFSCIEASDYWDRAFVVSGSWGKLWGKGEINAAGWTAWILENLEYICVWGYKPEHSQTKDEHMDALLAYFESGLSKPKEIVGIDEYIPHSQDMFDPDDEMDDVWHLEKHGHNLSRWNLTKEFEPVLWLNEGLRADEKSDFYYLNYHGWAAVCCMLYSYSSIFYLYPWAYSFMLSRSDE